MCTRMRVRSEHNDGYLEIVQKEKAKRKQNKP